MTTTRPLVTGPATAAVVMSALTATQGGIVIKNNRGNAVTTTIHRTSGAGTSLGAPAVPGTCAVRMPASAKTVQVISAHRKDDCGRKGLGTLAIR